jgi:ATP-dependent DNA helicase RecQ
MDGDKAQVIVATNAWMGIDKADVKTVIPFSYQKIWELLSGSRTLKKRWKAAVLLTNSDIIQVENQFIKVLPDKKFLNEMFIRLCSFFANCIWRRYWRKVFFQFESLLYEI